MSEKKNIVIKVKYPSAGSPSSSATPSSNVTTQWDYRRIGLALGGILLVTGSIAYFSGSKDSNEKSTEIPLAVPKQAIESKVPAIPDTPAKKPNIEIGKAVVREQLTKNIEKNEPVDKLKIPLKIGKKETVGVYYFAELKGMKGKTIYHEWLLNGELVSRKKVNISSDPWRTASKQAISYTMNNDWIVRLVDESGNQLALKAFNLELK